MFLVGMALAAPCNTSVLSVIPKPATPASTTVVLGKTVVNGVTLAGARGVLHSKYPPSAWKPVILHPETQDDWADPEMGTKRVERLDNDHLYQQTSLDILMGAVQVQRQVVVQIDWTELSDARISNCWQTIDHTPYQAQIAPWVNSAPFDSSTMGGWEIEALPDGGSLVSYQLWVPTTILPANVVAWAMSQTFPDLMLMFEGRVAETSGK